MRAARRARRLGDVAWGDLAYRVYTTALATLVVAVFLSGLIGDERLSAHGVARVVAVAPRWVGLALVVAATLGVRSGRRGGPLALEAADVHHLLLAPVDRSQVLRRPALSALGYGSLSGAAVGGLAGLLVSQRLPGASPAWVACGVLLGVMFAFAWLGSALAVASRRIPRVVPVLVVTVLGAWSVVDLVAGTTTAPATFAAQVAVWPVRFTPWPLLALAVVVAVAVGGVRVIGGLDMEAARRRTTLVGQLRFAVTQQDLRSVVLLRRQLASERPRAHPWPLAVPRRVAQRFPVVARDLQSLARWPLVRAARVLVLCVGAGLVLRATYSGTTPLLVVAGLLAFVAALDAIEPLAQELDHPTLTASFPVLPGVQRVRHLPVAVAVMCVGATCSLVVAWAIAPDRQVWAVGALTAVSGAACAVAAACVSTLSEDPAVAGVVAAPEIAGPRFVLRALWPPLLATLGLAPVVVAQRAARAEVDPVPLTAAAAVAALVLAAGAFVWVRYRDDVHAAIAEATGASRR